MSRSPRFAPFDVLDEPVALVWIRNLNRDRVGDWSLTCALRGIESGDMRFAKVPFGMAPTLALGRVYIDGVLAETTQIGELGQVFISALQDAEYVTLSEVPADIFSDKRPRTSNQKLLLYRTPELDLYIPPLELVRRLFLHDRVLANVILRHGGLADLWVPVPPSEAKELVLDFTSTMPQRLLTQAFVREFAWLAMHPTGLASWNSVARLSNPEDGILLKPPSIGGFTMTFRGLFGGGAAFVYEILSLPGKSHHFRRLRYTHPSLKKKAAQATRSAVTDQSEAQPPKPSEKVQKNFDIEGSPSRPRNNPELADWVRPGSDFIARHGSIRRQPLPQPAPSGIRSGPAGRQAEENDAPTETSRHEHITVSVSDISMVPKLPPLSFRTLQLAAPDYIGDLRPVVDTLRRMRKLLPSTMTVSSSICAMPLSTPLAMAGRYRRTCLVATFTSINKPPTVLLEIDHTGLTALSAVSIHAQRAVDVKHVEAFILTTLESLESNGHWPRDLERIGRREFRTQRIKRMLRHPSRADSAEYQTKWAAKLIEKLGL